MCTLHVLKMACIGSSNYLTGFALRIEYVNARLNTTFGLRVFNVEISTVHPPDLYKVTKHVANVL